MTAIYFKPEDCIRHVPPVKKKWWQKSIPIPAPKAEVVNVNRDVYRPDFEQQVGKITQKIIKGNKRLNDWRLVIRLRRALLAGNVLEVGNASGLAMRRISDEITKVMAEHSAKTLEDISVEELRETIAVTENFMPLIEDVDLSINIDVAILDSLVKDDEFSQRITDARLNLLSSIKVSLDALRELVHVQHKTQLDYLMIMTAQDMIEKVG